MKQEHRPHRGTSGRAEMVAQPWPGEEEGCGQGRCCSISTRRSAMSQPGLSPCSVGTLLTTISSPSLCHRGTEHIPAFCTMENL